LIGEKSENVVHQAAKILPSMAIWKMTISSIPQLPNTVPMQTLPNPVAPIAASTAAPIQDYVDPKIRRRKTRSVPVGSLMIGSEHPVAVQSMINEDTLDIEGSVAAIRRLHEMGCEIVRVTVPSMAHAKAMEAIREQLYSSYQPVPLVADVHHNGMKIALEVAQYVDNVRINPGLYVFEKPKDDRTEYTPAEFAEIGEKIRETLEPLVVSLRDQNKSMRIGVNHGSLAERMLFTYGDTPEGMVESALEFIRICESLNFYNIELSLKASNVPVMLAANRLMVQRMDELGMAYPLHLGVTEAGDGEYGRIKSTAGIGTLLAAGIGDTIRVSLTEAPEKEIPVCYSILQALGLRRTMVEYVACPSCGRTLFNLEEVLHKVREATNHLKGLNIAVMGCIVNGPGEMADADYGYVGKQAGVIALYRGKEEIKRVPQEEGVQELVNLIKADGNWVEPKA
jgi:(E)-4-hydroxy-3-methylbut-2-enyl-diphosphate synthase